MVHRELVMVRLLTVRWLDAAPPPAGFISAPETGAGEGEGEGRGEAETGGKWAV